MEEESISTIKVVLVGESRTGKTSLLTYIKGEEFQEEPKTTVGASCYNYNTTYNNKPYTFQIWDTAGDEKFHSINRYFYKDAAIILMLYDITDVHSFNQIKEYWVEEIKTKTNTNPVSFIVANKSDLFTEEKVPEQDARELAKIIKSGFGIISCKEGTGIKELMEGMMIMYQKYYVPPDDKDRKNNLVIDSRSYHSGRSRQAKSGGCCK